MFDGLYCSRVSRINNNSDMNILRSNVDVMEDMKGAFDNDFKVISGMTAPFRLPIDRTTYRVFQSISQCTPCTKTSSFISSRA